MSDENKNPKKMAGRQEVELERDPKQKKKRSRDAARQRRGQQNDEFFELASHLPLSETVTSQIDRLCVMRLATSYVKIKHIIRQVTGGQTEVEPLERIFDSTLLNALGGFLFVVGVDGVCIYCSPNVSDYLGLPDNEVSGNSLYKYIHSCDQHELAKQLGGEVPLEDMEIFDGLFCSDGEFSSKLPMRPVAKKRGGPSGNYRSFFIRMKSTLTSRGKSVNLNASIYRVVHCVGVIQEYQTKFASGGEEYTRCLLAVGSPLLSSHTFEVPLDRSTFTSTHMLDMKLLECEDLTLDILGYEKEELIGKSWYTYAHGCDINILKTCHDTMLSKGQSASENYRLLTKNGGWIWVQTKGNVVYSSSTCQPQYILCVNYVISGHEARDEVLSTEQMPSVIQTTANSLKRQRIKSECLDNGERDGKKTKCAFSGSTSESSISDAESSLSGLEELNSLLRHQSDYEDKLAEEYLVASDDELDGDVPGLEFLDAEDFDLLVRDSQDQFDKEEKFFMRAPFIPPPTIDEALYVLDCSPLTQMTNSNGIEEDIAEDISSRAPFMPPPRIDTILTFDDLATSPQFRGDSADYLLNDFQNPPSDFLDDETEDEDGSFIISGKDLHMIQMGPAIVPHDLLAKETQPKTERSRSTKQPSEHRITNFGKLPIIDGTCSVLPLVTNCDCEVNAPSHSLLEGPDLMLALEVR